MSEVSVILKKSEEKEELSGLKDGGHIIVKCSNCLAGLLDVWITRPRKDIICKVRANCPFCGDKSFVKEIEGIFHLGGYSTPKPEDPNEVIPSTNWIDFEEIDDVLVYKVVKANENAKAVKVK